MHELKSIREFEMDEVLAVVQRVSLSANKIKSEAGLTKEEYDILLKRAKEMAKSSDEREADFGKKREMFYIALLNNPTNGVNLKKDIELAKQRYEKAKKDYDDVANPSIFSMFFGPDLSRYDSKRKMEFMRQSLAKMEENIVSYDTFVEYRKYYDKL